MLYVCVYIYICIKRQKERERERERDYTDNMLYRTGTQPTTGSATGAATNDVSLGAVARCAHVPVRAPVRRLCRCPRGIIPRSPPATGKLAPPESPHGCPVSRGLWARCGEINNTYVCYSEYE